MKNKLLVFDLDGTIVNSKIGIVKTIQETMAEHFKVNVSEAEIIPFLHQPIQKIFRSVSPVACDPRQLIDADRVYQTLFKKNYSSSLKAFPEVEETLKELAQTAYLSTATNLSTSQASQILELLRINIYFDKIRGTDAGDEPKPSPMLIDEAMDEFDTNKQNTWMIGDSSNDIMAGKNAGVKTIALRYYEENNSIMDTNPDFIAKKFSDLIDILR